MDAFLNRNSRLGLFAVLAFFLVCITACHKKHHTVSRGFYYWKTSFSLSSYEQQRLAQAGCSRIYVRCFDVDWDEVAQQPMPVAVLRMPQKPPASFRYVPVVFITQQTIAKLTPSQTPVLVEHITTLLSKMSGDYGFLSDEIQIDCDWTQRTREAYFNLLRALKKSSFFKDKKLSCTIRLHQVKYRLRSGIPPADRGLIMCYNIGNLKQPGAHNSILDASLAKDYLKELESYPLPIDVALPLYSWCLHFREGKLVGILRNVAPEDVTNSPSLFHQSKGNVYACNSDTLWNSYPFRKGDELRVESPSLKDLQDVAEFTSRAARNDSLSIIIFHIDSLTLAKYSTHDLETVYNAYH